MVEACDLVSEWALDPRLAVRLANVLNDWERESSIGAQVISGFRTRAEQEELGRRGRPTAPFSRSTHTTCPSTGADVSINGFVTRAMKASFGRIVVMNGLRWGGGSQVDDIGIPSDWNHVDLGARTT